MRSDPDLAHDAAKGDRTAFTELMQRHQARVRGMARRLAGNAVDGDDIAQSAFLSAWSKLSTYRGGTFRAWICTVCWREFLQWRRRKGLEIEFDETAEIITLEDRGNRPDDKIDLQRALTQLTTAQRVCVVMCIAAGLSHQEAASATGWPLGTVKSHTKRGLDALKRQLVQNDVA